MQNDTASLRVLGWVDAGLLLVVAVLEIVFTKEGSGGLIRAAVSTALAVCVLGGIRLIDGRPWPGAVLASVGATLGAVFLIWALLPIPLAVAIVMLSMAKARRLSMEPSAPLTLPK